MRPAGAAPRQRAAGVVPPANPDGYADSAGHSGPYGPGLSGSAWAERGAAAEYDAPATADAGYATEVPAAQRPSRRHAAPDTGTDIARYGLSALPEPPAHGTASYGAGYDVPGSYAVPGGHNAPAGFDASSGFDGQSGFDAQSGFNARSGFDAESSFDAQAGFEPGSGFGGHAGFDHESRYDGHAGFDPRSGFDARSGFDGGHSGYDNQSHGYDNQSHGYDEQSHGYDNQSHGYDETGAEAWNSTPADYGHADPAARDRPETGVYHYPDPTADDRPRTSGFGRADSPFFAQDSSGGFVLDKENLQTEQPESRPADQYGPDSMAAPPGRTPRSREPRGREPRGRR
ncbi:hypothetical protein ACWEOZ_19805 [Actinoplanes sp. NPDC004185]